MRDGTNGARAGRCHPELSLGCLSPEGDHRHSVKLRLTWGGESGKIDLRVTTRRRLVQCPQPAHAALPGSFALLLARG